ncbi:MAG: ABC transporter permease [Anaerolineales bacterium]
MSSFAKFLLRRLLAVPLTLFIITLVLYAGVMLTPPEARVSLYMPPNLSARLTEAQVANLQEQYIARYHLRDPFPVQYALWVTSLLNGSWGFSPALEEDVLPALLRRTPVTLELAFYSLLVFVPLGLFSGALAGWKKNSPADGVFRALAFVSTSLPPFILSIFLLVVFYLNLNWFMPERISDVLRFQLSKETFHAFTGFLTLDSLLNGRPDIFADALRHLAMPVFTLSLAHWATLARITRASIIGERRREYILAARAHGLNERGLLWRHAFPNTFAPSLTSILLSAASIVTGVFVVEIIFNFNGVSDLITRSMRGVPDAPAALGFAVYSVLLVLLMTFFLDIALAIFDPRVRDEVTQ